MLRLDAACRRFHPGQCMCIRIWTSIVGEIDGCAHIIFENLDKVSHERSGVQKGLGKRGAGGVFTGMRRVTMMMRGSKSSPARSMRTSISRSRAFTWSSLPQYQASHRKTQRHMKSTTDGTCLPSVARQSRHHCIRGLEMQQCYRAAVSVRRSGGTLKNNPADSRIKIRDNRRWIQTVCCLRLSKESTI